MAHQIPPESSTFRPRILSLYARARTMIYTSIRDALKQASNGTPFDAVFNSTQSGSRMDRI